MSMTDPIADMLTRIRNAIAARKEEVRMPSSSIKLSIAEVLLREGYIRGVDIVEKPVQNEIRIFLKYGPEGEKVIEHIKRVSTPGCRRYRSVKDLPLVRNGLGISIVSTNQGVLSDRECRQRNVGGEVLCQVW